MTCHRIIHRPIRGRSLTLKKLRRQDRRISPASQAATINRANQIVADVLESKRRKFGGVGSHNMYIKGVKVNIFFLSLVFTREVSGDGLIYLWCLNNGTLIIINH